MPQPSEHEIEVFNIALELPPRERAAYLDRACAGDVALRQRVEELLKATEESCACLEGSDAVPPGPGGTVRFTLVPSEKAGDRIGRYKLLQQIGEGGCGVVYMAEQEEPVRRRVALKVIKLGMDTKSVIARFEAERQALALMDHPNIARVLDAGATDTGRPYFVMELVRGIKITDYCDQNHLSTRERLDLFIQVCRAIQHAHQKGIIHRDIKPSNILVTMDDRAPVPKVIDFGIAKATQGKLTNHTLFTAFEQFVGTPAYMSPEQAEMRMLDIDTRSDIYSLGVLLYELLTGQTPFDAKKLLQAGLDEIRRTIREQEPPRPSTRLSTMLGADLTTIAKSRNAEPPKLIQLVRGDLDWIVMKALDKDRTRRYETANGLAMDIQRHMENEPVQARPPSAGYRLQKTWQRNKTAFAAASLLAVVLVAATGISAWQAMRASQAETLAKQRLVESEANATLARERLADSEAISKFLTEVFQSPDPVHNGRTITVAETLGAAAKKLETDLTNQPARRAKLQTTLGLTYFALGLNAEAIPLQEKARDYYLAAHGLEHEDTLNEMNQLANSYDGLGGQEQRLKALKLREQVFALELKITGPEHTNTLKAMANVAISYNEGGRQDEALKLREQVFALELKINGPEDPDTLAAMYNLADSYLAMGRWKEGLKMLEPALPLFRKVLGPEHPTTLAGMQVLARFYDEAGRRDEGLKLSEQSLALYQKVLGPKHSSTLGAMNHLANCYEEAGRFDETLKLREEALRLSREAYGEESLEAVDAMNNLAISYALLARRDEALKLREQVLALDRKLQGPEHPDTIKAMGNLALSYSDYARPADALILQEQVVSLSRKVLGPEHSYTLMAMSQLASSYFATGRFDDALKLREEVLTLSRKVNGAEKLDTVIAMNNLANSYARLGRGDEALKLHEQVLEICRKVFGPERPLTLTAMGNLANSYDDAGRADEALKLREQVLSLTQKVQGPEHPDTILAMHNLASSYDGAGRKNEALKLREQVLPLYRKVLGPEHPDTILAMNNLANSYGDADRAPEALKLREETLTLSRKALGSEHPHTLGAMINLANSYDGADRKDDALKLREQALPLYRKVLGPENPETLIAMEGLAYTYGEFERRDEWVKLREDVLELSRKVLGPGHPDTLRRLNDLADAYDQTGHRDAALKLREESLALRPKVSGATLAATLNEMNSLADSYCSLGRNKDAIALMERACALDPKDRFESFRLATFQAWFGQDTDYESSRRQLVQQAEGTDQAGTADKAAKVFCLRPSTNAVLLAKALNLARQAVELGKSDPALPWYELGLGLAEYRNGRYAAAEQALTIAEHTAGDAHDITGTARLFRAMSLLRQDKPEEARKVFSQADAEMPPFPKGDHQPPAYDKSVNQDVLICWMAYKEAKALIEGPSAPVAEPPLPK